MPINQETKEYYTNVLTNEKFYEYMLEKYNWAEQYIFYYMYEIGYKRDNLERLLQTIKECDRTAFSKKLAYNYIEEFEKTRLNIGIIIPTCNRAETIDYLLSIAAPLYRRFGINVIIYDSSNNEETKIIVEKFNKNGYYNVIYSQYKGKYDGFSLDHKLIAAYKEYVNMYDYIWICRDGLIPVIDEIIEMLRYYARKKIGCIIVDTKSRVDNVEILKYYSNKEDCEELLLDQASRLQTLGMLIFSKEIIQKLLSREPLREENYSLWQMVAPLHLFAKEPYGIVFLTRNVFAFNIKASSTHFWGKAENAIQQWGYRWCNVLDYLPNEYAGVKDKVKLLYTVDFHPFTIGTIIRMRGWGGLKCKMVKDNAYYLKQVTKTSIKWFYVISVLPCGLARIISHGLSIIGDSNRVRLKKILKLNN
ncbi:MAG: glycosyltransferase family A protein [Anaerobutyricum hallii]